MLADARAEAVFASDLQPSQCPSAADVTAAVKAMVAKLRTRGCAACVAAEYGDHPDTATARMVWARDLVAKTFAGGVR